MSEHRIPYRYTERHGPATRGTGPHARSACLALLLAAGLLAGCTERAITVSEAELEIPEQTTASLTDSSAAARDVYYADDEAVVLEVEFDVNLVAVYKSFYAWWYFPNGRIYLREPVRNKFGSHRRLVTSMPIRGAPPASWPGTWRVQLTLRDRTLLERTFEIRPGSRLAAKSEPETAVAGAFVESAAAGSVTDPPLCPDPGSPPGTCAWEAPEEGSGGEAYLELLAPPDTPAGIAESPPTSSPAPVPASEGVGPARVSPRSGTVAASVPASVIEAADRARAARDEAMLAARSPPPPPPEPEQIAPSTQAEPGSGAAVDEGTDAGDAGTDTGIDPDTPERAWGAGRSPPPAARPASRPPEPVGVAAAGSVAPAPAAGVPRPASGAADCPGPCSGQAPEE